MTVAQALLSGLTTPSPSSRTSSGADSARSGASFRDTLDQASKGGARQSGRSTTADARDSAREAVGADAETEDRDAPASPAQEVSALSAVLAAITGGEDRSSAAGGAVETSTQVVVTAGGAPDDTILMPGQVQEAAEQALGADELLTLLSGEAAAEASQLPADGVEIKASVTAQETHLARETSRVSALARLADAELGGVTTPTEEAVVLPGASPEADTSGQISAQARTTGAAATAEVEPRVERSGQQSATDMRGPAQAEVTGLDRNGTGAGSDGRSQQGGDGLNRGGASQGSQTQTQTQAGTVSTDSNVFMALPQGVGVQGARPAVSDAGLGEFDAPLSDQIANEVRAELRATGAGETSSEGKVKVLQLELKPANLGAVTVRIALKDNVVSVHIEAQRRETVAAIERERDALMNALSSSGYTVDSVSAAPQSEGARTGGSAQGFSGSDGAPSQAAGGQSGFDGASGGQEGRPGEAARGDSAYHAPGGGKDTAEGGVRSDANGLYV